MGISSDQNTFMNISMGQGQEEPAENVVKRFAKQGGWVMLQNCHLMQSWVPKLERLLEVVSEDAHPNFRCFISAEPPPIASMKNMPESLMQVSSVMSRRRFTVHLSGFGSDWIDDSEHCTDSTHRARSRWRTRPRRTSSPT
jgi:hypothetical protein